MISAPRFIACAIAFVATGCTFTGLADYDVPLCDPTLQLAQDPCNSLNNGAQGCLIFQCDSSTRHCSRRTRDADKDGDPPPECGGHDCDDNNASRSGIGVEVCDGIDNDCDGISDNGMLKPKTPVASTVPLPDQNATTPDLAFSSNNGTSTYASYSGTSATCIHGFALGSEASDGGCESVGSGSAPAVRQSRVQPVGLVSTSALGVAFIDQASACGKEQLDFTNSVMAAPSAGDCGASLPTLATFAQNSEAVIAYYDATLASRTDPVAGCSALTAASLHVRYVDNPAGTAATIVTSVATIVGAANTASSTRPPALVPVPQGSAILLASPLGNDVGLYALLSGGTVVPLAASIPALTNARSVAMAIGSDGATTRVAIVAEQGCPPSQSMTLVVAAIDPGGPSLSGAAGSQFKSIPIVASGAALATAPAVAWIADRNEWWVSWTSSSQKIELVRVADDASKADSELAVSGGLLATIRADAPIATADAGAASGASVYVQRVDRSAIDEVNVTCP